jgi:hypothetical protein
VPDNLRTSARAWVSKQALLLSRRTLSAGFFVVTSCASIELQLRSSETSGRRDASAEAGDHIFRTTNLIFPTISGWR